MDTPVDASQMALVFFSSDSTPLFLGSWAPSSSGTYASACISIAALAVIHRLLIAVRDIVLKDPQEQPGPGRRGKVPSAVTGDYQSDKRTLGSFDKPCGLLGVSLHYRLPSSHGASLQRLHNLHVSMLAAMTMNIGYFVSALSGIFIGTLLAGRFNTSDDGSCH
ncbi:hypothetical protein PG993_012522 [Apiospora rasikravindrae]|uniref:Copper transport protein n=1 Tax=Apiospora rasikravindrae TaxID=990691 RepID=A0ABR1S4G2_9PEZI